MVTVTSKTTDTVNRALSGAHPEPWAETCEDTLSVPSRLV